MTQYDLTIVDTEQEDGLLIKDNCAVTCRPGATSLNIPSSVTSIGAYAFNERSNLSSITFTTPSSVTSIGEYAFYKCSNLASITIPGSVTSIGTQAFYYCSNLTSVTIPSSVTSIGGGAFGGCTSLTTVICKGATPATLGDYAFKYVNHENDEEYIVLPNLQNIYVPANSVDTYKTATNWSDYAEKIKAIPAVSVTTSAGATTFYDTFAAALEAAADGSTIKLNEDVTVIESANNMAITIGANKFPNGLTLDLNSHGITIENTTDISKPSFLINKENKVTIKNGELIVKNYGFAVSCMSPLTLESVKIDGSQLSYLASMKLSAIYCGADLTCKDCIIKARHEDERALSVTNGIATLTGTTTVEGNIHLSNNTLRAASTVTINQCTLETGTNYGQIGTLSIANGTFTAPTGFAWSAVSEGLRTLYSSALSLNDEKDPTSTLQALVAANAAQDITLTGRTLYKDGYYNTLCLPFALTTAELAASPLKGCTLKEVSGASLNTTTNVMTIQLTEVNALEAGKPYLIKWAAASENIQNPTFTGVTITTATPSTISGDNLDVVGIFAPKTMATSDTDLFFLGAENKFYTSNVEAGSNLKGYRCFFMQKKAGSAKALTFVLDEDVATGISQIENGKLKIENGKIIENGKVVIIKNGKKYNLNGQIFK